MKPIAAALLAFGIAGAAFAGPQDGVVRAGAATITSSGAQTRIQQSSDRAVIDWRSFGIGAAEQVLFQQPRATSATLNRVTGDQVSVLLGRLDANGRVVLVNPNGVVIGAGAQVNVASLIASTANISNANFMAGRLQFDQPGKPGAEIVNAGTITAAEGGLVALVAPHVRNDGLIQARLGKVILGAADTFTIDLYGDELVSLALTEGQAGVIRQAGIIDVGAGRAVLVTAADAKNVLDNVINMSGTIKADSAVAQGGKIYLLGEGASIDVGGALSANGATGGGTIHVGGGFQGAGVDRARSTTVETSATLQANATGRGNGGEVVVWSDGNTSFAGAIQAKGGAAGGDGGRMEVSGKSTLAFLGSADASAPAGTAGSLLLDPAILDLGPTEAGLISRVLRTGTSTTLAADIDINVNSLIDGRGRAAGGGLTLTAGNNINVNDFVVTNNGAINLFATAGTVNVASGKAVFSGSAPLTVRTGGTLHTGPFLTAGMLSLISTAGAVAIDTFIDGGTGRVDINAAGDVNINQPIVNMATGNPLNVTAGNDVNVNAQVDGRGGVAGGAANITAARNVNINEFVVTNNGAINVTATNGTATVASGKGLFSGTAALSMSAGGSLTSGISSSGPLALTSHSGSVNVAGLIDGATGATTISAAVDVNINQPVLNMASGRALAVTAGNDINVGAQLDGRGGAAGGSVTMTAGRNLNVNDFIVTNNGAINLTATNGAATVAAGKGLFAGTAPIAVSGRTGISAAALSGGSVTLGSSAGAVGLNGIVDPGTGRVDISAATDINVNQPVLSPQSGSPFNATAGQDINVNGQIDGRGGAAGGAVNLAASRNVTLNESVVTNDGAINVTATTGGINVATGKGLFAGSGAVKLTAASDIATGIVSAGSLNASSSAGSVTVSGLITANTGRVDLNAGLNVSINQPVLNMGTGNPLNVTAGQDITVNAQVDGRDGVAGGAATFAAGRNVAVNESIITDNGNLSITAGGLVTVAAAKGLFTGTAPLAVTAGGDLANGAVIAGTVALSSSGGTVTLGGVVDGSGPVTVHAGSDVNVNQPVLSLRNGTPLAVSAGRDINVNTEIDGRGGVAGGSVSLGANRNVNLNEDVATADAAISVSAQTGAVATAAGKGLFAGSGPISVTSGATLSTGLLSTTGAISAQSTAGSLNIAAPIDPAAGAITLAAAAAVNINQPLANPRSNAPLTITAGTDINVNSPIDVRDASPQNPSGTVTLTAGQNVNLNQDIVTNNAAIAVTAASGTLVTAPTKGLYAGTAPISVTTGATLDTGITSTTGSLTFTSTGGGINVATPIGDTTGAVTIQAAGAVNVNQPITNIKTGSPLVIAAGTDLNVNAQIDGQNGTAAGGSVSLAAGNNLRLFDNIVTNNGPINLTTITGSVFLAPVSQDANLLILATPKQVRAGNAPITIVSGGDFSTGAPPPQPLPDPATLPVPVTVTTEDEAHAYQRSFLKQYVQLITTGALNITSTNGDVNVIAPISDETGPVTITAGHAINVMHKINSNNQPIVLNGGTGGIVVKAVDDSCPAFFCTNTAPVDARMANLTLNSIGNIDIQIGFNGPNQLGGVATAKTLTIDTRSQILEGRTFPASGAGFPDKVFLNADQGMTFSAYSHGEVSATSIAGSINLTVDIPQKLRITTGTPNNALTDCADCNISTGGAIGPDVVLNAGGNVNLTVAHGEAATLISRHSDVNLTFFNWFEKSLDIQAARDIKLNANGCANPSDCGLLWLGLDPSSGFTSTTLSMTAGRDIVASPNSPIHISYSPADVTLSSTTLVAHRDLTLGVLETLGPVTLTAETGNIVLNNPVGGHIVNNTCPAGSGCDPNSANFQLIPQAPFNPSDLGVTSLTLNAPQGSISMEGARAEGAIQIVRGVALTTNAQISSTLASGGVTIKDGQGNVLSTANPFGSGAIGSQNQLTFPSFALPSVPPGPSVPPPAAPGSLAIGAPALPLLTEIAVVDQPGAGGGSIGAPGANTDIAALPTAPTGAGGPAVSTASASLPGGTGGTSVGVPGGTSSEENIDTSSAQRAALQQGTNSQTGTGSDGAIIALAGEENTVLCPAGVAPGTSVPTKDASGNSVTVKCK